MQPNVLLFDAMDFPQGKEKTGLIFLNREDFHFLWKW